MIYSFRPGRVRLRAMGLRDPEAANEIQSLLSSHAGVLSSQINIRTGSLLVHYNPESISQEELQMALDIMEQRFPDISSVPKHSEKCAGKYIPFISCKLELKILTGAFMACLAGTLGGRTAHIVAGGVFTLLTARHMYTRRKLLM